MADPHTSAAAGILGGAGLIASLTGAIGPVAAEWAIVLGAALVGAAIAARDRETPAGGAVWWIAARGIGMSLGLTALVAKLASVTTGLASADLLIPVAFVIAWKQEGLLSYAATLIPKRGP